MSLSAVTIHRPSGFNPYGEPETPTTITVPNCIVWPAASTEAINLRDQVTSDYVCLMPPGTDIRDTDRMVLPDGQTYQVTGVPAIYSTPFSGWDPGIEVRLSRWEG